MAVVAIVRVRGIRNIKPNLRRTMELLRLGKPNHCVVMAATPQTMGMANLVKDYVTFGEISEETLCLLLRKRGEKGSKSLSEVMKDLDIKKAAKEIFGGKKVRDFSDPVFRLRPPKKGIRNIKLAYPAGALGKRDNMDSFIKRMV